MAAMLFRDKYLCARRTVKEWLNHNLSVVEQKLHLIVIFEECESYARRKNVDGRTFTRATEK